MTLSLLFWIVFLLDCLFGGWVWLGTPPNPRWGWGVGFLTLLLLFALGMAVFGSPIKGG